MSNKSKYQKIKLVDLSVGKKTERLFFDMTRKSYAYWYDSQEKYRIENGV